MLAAEPNGGCPPWRLGPPAATLDRMPASPAPRTERLLARYAATRDAADMEELVRRFEPLARSLARRYRSSSVAPEDLDQAALLGLVKAVRRFDPARGCALSTFAVPTILGEVRRQCRDSIWPAHVPRPVQERVQAVRAAGAALTAELGRSPRTGEIAGRLCWSEELVVEGLTAAGTLNSVSLEDGDGDDEAPAVAERFGALDPGFELAECRAAIESALTELDDDERRVLRLRFADDRTFGEIGRELALAPAQAARLLRSSMAHLAALAA
jgi:RNA polymerase sigma-B factor